MKRLSIMLFAAVAVVGCADRDKSGIVISDQNAENIAYDMSYELATKAVEAQNYEEFKRARVELEGYEGAFRDQIGGEAYLLYLEECNAILGEL